MCFKINQKVKSSNCKIGYKVVRLFPAGTLRSVLYGRADWNTPRGMRRRSPGPTWVRSMPWIVDSLSTGRYAKHGIYIFRSVQIARCNCYPVDGDVILKVLLKPEDFIFEDSDGKIATYQKVTIAEEQPYLDWYD